MSADALVILADGFEDIEAVTVIDVLRRGNVEVTTAALGDRLEVRSAHGLTTRADGLLSDVAKRDFDAVILPGGSEGTGNLRRSGTVMELLRRQHEQGRLICAICAAPLVLMDAEVLEEGMHVTCYPTCVTELDRPSADVPVVEDGGIITGQAPGSAMLFALVILKTLMGEKAAQRVARGLVTDILE